MPFSLRYEFTRFTSALRQDMFEPLLLLLVFDQPLASEVVHTPTEHYKFRGCVRWHKASFGEFKFRNERLLLLQILLE